MHMPIILDALTTWDLVTNVLYWIVQAKLVMCIIVWAMFGLILLFGLCDFCIVECIKRRKKCD